MAPTPVSEVKAALEDLVTTYHELNGDAIDELDEQPSALEFMRYVAKNRPFVVRGGASRWPAVQRWSYQHLIDMMKDSTVNVAITPHGSVSDELGGSQGGGRLIVSQ